ncbi:hypothetical protein ZWY2020_051920 [Hordeum vulgare]|nr:hypothetical protein ZWY2020_051920 [Hordeum vulgare]
MVVRVRKHPCAAVQAMSLEPSRQEQQTFRALCDYDLGGDFDNVVYSLDGLLVLRQWRHELLVVCNPATRQWTNLPEMGSYCAVFECGFYLHASNLIVTSNGLMAS